MRRIIRFLVGAGLAGLAVVFYLALSGTTTLPTVEANSLPGTATLSGTVDSPKPFQAAQVYLRNVDKRMLYMVYTSEGQYRAINLFPGNYELSVKAKGLDSSVQKLVLNAGQNARANLSLRDATSDPNRRPDVEYLSFDQIYPPGRALEVAKRTCFVCHGQSFLPSKHWNEAQWNGALDLMRGKGAEAGGVMILEKDMSDQERELLLKYLVENFGPDSKTRVVRVDKDLPVDEKSVAKAMYIEYYLPTDPPGQGVNDPQYARATGFAAGRRMGQDPRFDPDGNVWLTDRGQPNRIVKLNPRTGEMKEFLTPRPKAGLHDLTIDQKTGIIWVPENEGVPASQMKLLAFNPKAEKWEQEYPLDPANLLDVPLKHAQSLAVDSKGNVFVGMILGDGLSKWDRETKKVTTFPIPPSITGGHGSLPYGVVADKNDNIWIALARRGKILKFDTKTNQFTEYVSPTHPAFIRRLNVDSKNNIWFGTFSAGTLVRLDQATGKMTEWKIPSQVSQPYDVAEYAGNIWIADAGQEGTLIQFNPQTEKFTFFPSPQARADKPKIQITKEGAIWYSPRSSREYPGLGVLYPDMDKMTTFAAHY